VPLSITWPTHIRMIYNFEVKKDCYNFFEINQFDTTLFMNRTESNTKSTSETMMSLRHELKGFVSFHSFSQILMIPWGYTKRLTDDYDELMTVAREAARRLMKKHNTYWKVGPPSHILYEASGKLGRLHFRDKTYTEL
jgi:hypothetical protein